MKNGLKPVSVKRVSDQVFEQLRDLIFRGELKPGEKIMPERNLSEALGVSRTTVRNAINKLVVLGLLEHQLRQLQPAALAAAEIADRTANLVVGKEKAMQKSHHVLFP